MAQAILQPHRITLTPMLKMAIKSKALTYLEAESLFQTQCLGSKGETVPVPECQWETVRRLRNHLEGLNLARH